MRATREVLRIERILAIGLGAGVIGFVALLAAAMAFYPGGTWLDRGEPGHHFWRNFFCDLTQPVALNGAPNPIGSALGQAAMLALAAAFVPFWILIPPLFPEEKVLGAVTRTLGLISAAGLVAVPLTPSLKLGASHMIAVFVASIPGILAAVLAAIGLRRVRQIRHIATGTLVLAALDAALYLGTVISGGPIPAALPALQKLAALGLVTWMASVAAASRRRPS